jgi:hypothetical protein
VVVVFALGHKTRSKQWTTVRVWYCALPVKSSIQYTYSTTTADTVLVHVDYMVQQTA